MLLTVLLSAGLVITGNAIPGIHAWAIHSLLRIDYEQFILHGLLSLLLFAGAFLLDLTYLAHEKFAVGRLAALGTVLSTAIVGTGIFFAAPLLGFHPPSSKPFSSALISPTTSKFVVGSQINPCVCRISFLCRAQIHQGC